MATVTMDDVNKVYDNGFHVIHDLSLDIADSEFLVLVGPSGCGKSTALRMVAGLETITGGEMRIGDRVVNDVQPKDRDIAMVFQNYALYPHMTVFDNIAFALKLARVPKDEIDTRVRKAAAILELEPYLDRKPGQLSGGQRQRVAMGRAIVRQPEVFLMDEPLSNLDAKLRVQMRAEIARLQRELGRDHHLRHPRPGRGDDDGRPSGCPQGRLPAAGRHAAEPLRPPTNVFVAAFIGSPSMNLYDGTLTFDGDAGSIQIGSQTIAIPTVTLTATGAARVRRPTRRRRHPARGLRGRRASAGARRRPPHHAPRSSSSRRSVRSSWCTSASTPARRLRRPRRPRGGPRRAASPTPSPASARAHGSRVGDDARSPSPPRTCTSSTPRPTRPSGAESRVSRQIRRSTPFNDVHLPGPRMGRPSAAIHSAPNAVA